MMAVTWACVLFVRQQKGGAMPPQPFKQSTMSVIITKNMSGTHSFTFLYPYESPQQKFLLGVVLHRGLPSTLGSIPLMLALPLLECPRGALPH